MLFGIQPRALLRSPKFIVSALLVSLLCAGLVMGQLNQSGGGGSAVTLQAGSALAGKFGIDQTTPGTTNGVQVNAALPAGTNLLGKFGIDQTTPGTTNAVALTAGTAIAGKFGIDQTTAGTTNGVVVNSGTITAVTAITNALPAGANILGSTFNLPAGCSGTGTAYVIHNTVGVAVSTGTSVSSVTGCVVECFVNNITNSAVTLRIQDKTGTPIIWIGGNGDFSIPPNSNMGCGANGGMDLGGVVMASGITAIAGTASALNLHLLTRE